MGVSELILELNSVSLSKLYSAWRGLAFGLIGQIMDRNGTPSPLTIKDVVLVLGGVGIAATIPSAAVVARRYCVFKCH